MIPDHRYRFDYEHPGPLAPDRSEAFFGHRYSEIVLDRDLVVYRVGTRDNPLEGSYFTLEPPLSEAQARIDGAIKEQWTDARGEIGTHHDAHAWTIDRGPASDLVLNRAAGHPLSASSYVDTVYEISLPKGTTVYVGPVSYQKGALVGGPDTMQVMTEKPWAALGGTEVDHWDIGQAASHATAKQEEAQQSKLRVETSLARQRQQDALRGMLEAQKLGDDQAYRSAQAAYNEAKQRERELSQALRSRGESQQRHL